MLFIQGEDISEEQSFHLSNIFEAELFYMS